MNLRTIGLLLLFFAFLGIALVLIFFTGEKSTGPATLAVAPNFTLLQMGRAGDHGYALISWNGSGTVHLLALNQSPQRKISILRDPAAISSESFDAFVDTFSGLQAYGFDINVVSYLAEIRDGIYIIPTGAMPSYALDGLSSLNRTTIYLGQKNLILKEGTVREEEWYARLDGNRKSRLQIYETTLDEMYETNSSFLPNLILEQVWARTGKKTYALNSTGTATLILPLQGARYLRLLYARGSTVDRIDSAELPARISINASPALLFPWQKSDVRVAIPRTNGSAFLYVFHDGEPVFREPIGRVSEPNLFFFRFQFSEPGEYIMRVSDNESELANGWLHIQELGIRLAPSRGTRYFFNVTVDGQPVDGEATVRLNHSNQSSPFYIRNGELVVPARLKKGSNLFIFDIFGHEHYLLVDNRRESILDVYLRWGLPGVLLVGAVYAFARLARRPVYRIRFGDVGKDIRKDVHVRMDKVLRLFPEVRRQLGIEGPLTAREFALGLKRSVTEGAEVTDGNVEAILKKLSDIQKVESFQGYYQLAGEGDTRQNTLRRLIREALIEHGIPFEMKGNRYLTRDFEVGLLGEKFEKKAYVVIEDLAEREPLYKSMPPREAALLRVQEMNGKIEFVTPEMLRERL